MTRALITSAFLFATLAADAQVLTPNQHDDRNSRDPYYRNDRYGRNDGYYGRDDGYYGRDDRRNRRRDDGYYGRNDRRNRRDDGYYGRNGGSYGSGDASYVVSGVLNDIRRVGRNGYRFDNHERKHIEKAQEELSKFMDKYQRGDFDRGKLDKAAEALEHLANAQQLSARDRNLMGNGAMALRDLRNGGNGSYRSGGGSIWDVLGGGYGR